MNTKTTETAEMTESNALARKLDIRYFCHLFLRKAWMVALFAVLSLAAAIVYLVYSPKIYASRAVVQVEQEPPKVVDIQEIHHEEFKEPEELYTVAQTLTNATLVLRVIKANGLDQNPLFAPPKRDGSGYLDSELVERFMAKLLVTLRRGTRLIDITVEDTDPKQAQQLAQSMVDEFVSQSIEQKFSVARGANDALLLEARRLKAKLEQSEQALQQYRRKYNAVSLEEKQNIIVEKLKELNLKVTEASSTRLRLEADVALIQSGKAKTPEDLLLLSSVTALPEVADLRKQLADKETVFKNEDHIRGLQEMLNRMLLKSGAMLVKSYETAKATEAKLQAALRDQEQAALQLDNIAIPYHVLVREVEADRTLYESVLRRMKETNLSERLREGDVRLIESPLVAARPVRPLKRQILMLALLGGLVIGSGLIVGTELFDSSIHNVDEAERIFGLPGLASVPRSKRRNRKKESALTADPASYEAEAFRSLRTTLSLLDRKKDITTVLFTSATPGEGKTYCAFNYAVALAQLGLRTLLIDADLRRPTLTKNVLGAPEEQGLSACLSGHANEEDCYKSTGVENLFLLGGGRARRPLELLASCDFAGLLNQAFLQFDRIVLDSAPINAVCDTQLIVQNVQSVCLVIRAAKTPRHAIKRAFYLLEQAGVVPDGIVLNRVVRRSRSDYYSSDHAGGYAQASA